MDPEIFFKNKRIKYNNYYRGRVHIFKIFLKKIFLY